MNRETRRTLCEDAWLVALIVVAILLGCAFSARAAEPQHWSALPSAADFAAVKGAGSVVVAVDEATWRDVLGRLVLADDVAKERDAAQALARAATDASDALRAQVAALETQAQHDAETIKRLSDALEAQDAALMRCDRRRGRFWQGLSLGLASGLAVEATK